MPEKITQTAGRDQLGGFAPLFAKLNDEVLFGQVWNQPGVDVKTKCIITVVALMSSGITDPSLKYHLENAKAHGVTREETAAIITHVAFYVGWLKAWAVFNLAKEVWGAAAGATDAGAELSEKDRYQQEIMFPIGEPNDAFAKFFVGQSYLAPIHSEQIPVFNVTFEPGCRNHWHIHHASSGGGQLLVCVGGRGYHQVWGGQAEEMRPGDVVSVAAGVKHWHGAASDSWFSHLAFDVPGENKSNEWLEPVDPEEYARLP